MIIARLRAALALSLKTVDPLVARLCRSRPNANEQQRGAPLKLCETAARNKDTPGFFKRRAPSRSTFRTGLDRPRGWGVLRGTVTELRGSRSLGERANDRNCRTRHGGDHADRQVS